MDSIVVVDYDPEWPALFEQLRAWIWSAVSEIATAVEHVGSTAVPGLAAKPVIDLDVVVPRGSLSEGIVGLEALGYEHQGDLGIPEREAFRAPSGSLRHHLYLCPEGSPALANHLGVRDYLRTHPSEARSYAALKKDLAARFPQDIDRYVEGKSGFLLQVLKRVGFERSALEDIERMNRRC